MSLENQLHNEGDSKKEQRITYLKNRINQIEKQNSPDTAIRKSIETVTKSTKDIRLDYINDNTKNNQEHKSMLDDFQL